MASIGDNIRKYRLAKGWNQVQLGEAINVGKNKVSLVETGKSVPDAETLYLIAEALDVTPNDLYGIVADDERIFEGCNAVQRAFIREVVLFLKGLFKRFRIG